MFGGITGDKKKKAVEECCCDGSCSCDGRCVPLVVREIGGILFEIANDDCANPLPVTLGVEITSTQSYGTGTCFNASGTIVYKTVVSGGQNCWEGNVSGVCNDCTGAIYPWTAFIRLCCLGGRRFSATMSPRKLLPGSGTIGEDPCPEIARSVESDAVMCDPFLFSECFAEFVACFENCVDQNGNPIDPPSFTTCVEVYELP